jgi:Tfp pilus assembly protein PilF
LTQLGHHAEAFEASQRALALDPGLPEAALQVARQQRAAGLLADAATTLDRAIEAGARTGAVYLERAVLHLTGRRLPEAEAALRQAMERDPTNRIAIERTALVVNELGRYREAAQLFERLVALQPDRSDIWRTLGALYIARLDDPTNAARCFRHALRTERDPRRQQELRALLAELTR